MPAYEVVQENLVRKCSVASIISSTQEKLAMKINFFQFIALRKWADMESEAEGSSVGVMKMLSGWKKLLNQNRGQKSKVTLLKQKRFEVSRDVVLCPSQERVDRKCCTR
jgi:hypothetical protein